MKRLDAKEKVKLLAGTYLDAVDSGRTDDTDGRSPFESKSPKRNDLWRHGSYAALELAMNALRESTARKTPFTAFWRVYVTRTAKIGEVAPHKRHGAEQGLTFVTARVKQLTNGNIYVPPEVTENAGWTGSDARAAQRPKKAA